jgi:hypothetical protein
LTINVGQHLLVNNNNEVSLLPIKDKAISIFIAPETLVDVKSIIKTNSIEVFNAAGQLVISTTANTQFISIDLSKFPKGTYIVHLKSSEEVFTEEIIRY